MPQRNITLTPELDQWIEEQMQSGFYSNVSEFMREALRNFQRIKALENLEEERLALIHQRGLDDYHAGRYTSFKNREGMTKWFEKRRAEKIAEYHNQKAAD